MLPLYERLDPVKPVFKIPFGRFCIATVCLPFLSFLFCVIWCLLFFFDRSTSTHCDVKNYLPSISAAIGNYQPQRLVWQLAICIHFVPRLVIALMYVQYYEEIIRRNRRQFSYLACALNIIENFALLGLSLWTSSANYDVHKVCFVTFIAMSEIYMLVVYLLNKNGRKVRQMTKIEKYSLDCKRNLFLVNLTSFACAAYCFMRHNWYCEPGVYTLFALAEYIVVLTNMGYHITSYWDFAGRSIAFDWVRGLYFDHV